jgi:hypothetical protein
LKLDSYKHKITSVIIATVATYFGFQSLELILGIYQVETYFVVAWYVYAFHVFWLVFIFDLHFKTHGHFERARMRFQGLAVFWDAFKSRTRHLYHWIYIRKYLNYLLLPTIFYWSVILLMYLNPFHELFKDGLIIASTAALAVTYWYFKEAFSRHMEVHEAGLKVLNLVKLLAAYLVFASLFAVGWYYGVSRSSMMAAAFVLTFLLAYQALYQHRLLTSHVYPAMLMLGSITALSFGVVYLNWGYNYYTAALIVSVAYNLCWGVLHRYLDRTLTRKLLWEYVFMFVVVVSFILATHDFKGRILE